MKTLGERLREAIGAWSVAGKRPSIRKFHAALKDQEVPGHSRHMIHAYLADRQLPSLAFLEAAASILGVREPWLAYEDGEMTEAAERVAVVERGGEENQLAEVLDAMPKLYTRSPMVRATYLEALRRVIEARPDRDELTDEKIVGLASNLWAAVSKMSMSVGLMTAPRRESKFDHDMYAVTAFQAIMIAVGRPVAPSESVVAPEPEDAP